MYLLHNIGVSPSEDPNVRSNYNTREEIEALPKHTLLSFDGIYKNVWENRDILKDRPVILFVMGGYVGEDNRFDKGMPHEEYCDWWHLMDLVTNYGCEIAWHSWFHPDLRTLNETELRNEVTPPFPMKKFAYPHGIFNEQVIEAVKKAGFQEAFSVFAGDDSDYQRTRNYLNL